MDRLFAPQLFRRDEIVPAEGRPPHFGGHFSVVSKDEHDAADHCADCGVGKLGGEIEEIRAHQRRDGWLKFKLGVDMQDNLILNAGPAAARPMLAILPLERSRFSVN